MRSDGSERVDGAVPEPRASGAHDDLPHALTFFLTAGQRRAVLAAIRQHGQARAAGLLRALGLEDELKNKEGE